MKGRFVEEINKKKENKDLVGVRKPKKKAYENLTRLNHKPVLGLEPRTCALRMRRSTN